MNDQPSDRRIDRITLFIQSFDNHSTSHWIICVCLKPFASRLNHLTSHWIICVCLKPLVNVWVTSYFTQIIMGRREPSGTRLSRPFVIKLNHFAHGIWMDYNLNKPILVWRYCFNIYSCTSKQPNYSHLTKSFVV